MALQKEKVLASGESGNYWRVSHLVFKREGMVVSVELALYKDSALAAAGAAPLPMSHRFTFTISQPEIAGNIVGVAYTKIKAMIDALHPPISGSGPDASHYPDLVDALDV
jgi:hypothetical protein